MLFGDDWPRIMDSLSCCVGGKRGRHTLCVAHAGILAKHTRELCMYLLDQGGTMIRLPVGRPLLDDGIV